VLITGHTGFKGAWLYQWLNMLGADVTGIALPPDTQPSLFELADLGSSMRSHFQDIRDGQVVCAMIAEAEPEIVIHLAAQALVRRGYEQPLQTLETNVLGTAHVLEAVRYVSSVRCVLIVTSDKCYRLDPGQDPCVEGDRLGGRDPYSASKACAEIVAECWRRSFLNHDSLPGIASARAGNVIGGGDWSADRLIPDCVRAFRQGRSVEIRNPGAVRPWQHVLDALGGYLVLAERLHGNREQFGQAWNFGPDPAGRRAVIDVVRQFAANWNRAADWKIVESAAFPEAPVLLLDASRACRHLGWCPVLGTGDSLDWTAEWYIRQGEGENATKLCAEQIERFHERARGLA
jgi:CDP-glucose 4,6-dehydratase